MLVNNFKNKINLHYFFNKLYDLYETTYQINQQKNIYREYILFIFFKMILNMFTKKNCNSIFIYNYVIFSFAYNLLEYF